MHRKKTEPGPAGARGFGPDYWAANYSAPETMEGIANAQEYVRYAKSFFDLEGVPIDTLADLGFGLGPLFREFLYVFQPSRALGIDASAEAVRAVRAMDLDPYNRIDVRIKQTDLLRWCRDHRGWTEFDLGVCTSVFQYLGDEELREIVPVLAERFEYLYLTVPTDRELERQVDHLGFHDTWAIRRSRAWYQRLLRPHFTFLSCRILESKVLYDEGDTQFTDLLFRF